MGEFTVARLTRGVRTGIVGLAVSAVVAAAVVVAGAAPASAAQLPGPAPVEQRNAATVTSDALPTVQIDSGVVWAQVINGNTVYAGGSFTNARPAGAAPGTNLMPRSNILAYDINTGAATSFAPTINGAVKSLALSPDGTRLYVGGSFTQVDGQARFNVAAFDTATGALLTNFKPAVGGSYVNAIVANDTTVYFGGLIAATGGVTRKNLAAVSAANGALLGWAPTTDLQVDSMVINPTKDKIVVAGRFEKANDTTSRGLAAFDPTTGALVPYQVTSTIKNGLLKTNASGTRYSESGIFSLTTDSTGGVYGTAWLMTSKVNGNLEGLFALDGQSGAIRWIADCHGDHYGIYSDGTNVYSTSHEHDCSTAGGFPELSGVNLRHATAYTAETKGTLTRTPSEGSAYTSWAGYPAPAAVNWYPEWTTGTATGMGQAGWTATGNGTYLIIGGEFPFVNGERSQGIARFAVTPPGGAKQGPRVSGADWVPTASSGRAGTAQVQIAANWDRDDLDLTYEVWDDGAAQPSATLTAKSPFWNRAPLTFTIPGLAPTSTHTFTVVARDGDGNVARSAPATVTVSGTVLSDYADRVLDDGASLYWNLDRVDGGVDLAGTNDARFSTGTRFSRVGVPGTGDGSYAFDGQPTSSAATTRSLTSPSQFAVEVWFKTTTRSGGKLVGFGSSASGNSAAYLDHLYIRNDGSLAFGVFPGSAQTITTGSSAYNDGAWHHAVGQVGPQRGVELFVDGVLVATASGVTSSAPYGGYWRLGGDSLTNWPGPWSSDWFAGSLDEFAVYPKVLSSQQVAEHHRRGAALEGPTAIFTDGGDELTKSFDASGSTAPAGRTIDSYTWEFGDGSTATGANVQHAFAQAGTYPVRLTVVDDSGASSSVTRSVGVSAPHVAPTASFTVATSDLTATFDGSGSVSAPGSSVSGYTWDFGDGTTGTSATPSHTYAAGGTYSVGLTVTDSAGATSTVVTKPVTVAAPPAQAFAARDEFERSLASGWGSALVGGAWSASTGFSVTDGAGKVSLAAGQTRANTLTAVSVRDANATAVVSADKVANGGGAHINLVIHKSAAGEYRLKVRTLSTGAVSASITKLVGTTETTLVTKTLTGYTFVGNARLQLRLTSETVNGATAMHANVWPDRTAEPAGWLLSAADSTAALQAAGQVGVLAYLSGTTTNAPVSVSVDRFTVLDATTPTAPVHADPVASFTAAASDLSLAVDASGSTASDGATLSYAWNWGDGTPASTGATATHAFAAAGSYSVTLTVTDSLGGSATTTRDIAVTAPVVPDPGPPLFVARDDFERTVGAGWGSALTGGTWATASGFSVSDGVGESVVAAGQTRTNLLTGVSAQNVDARLTFSTDRVADGGGQHVNYLVHKTAAGDYRAKLRIAASGAVQVSLAKVVGTTETIIVTKTLSGYTHTAGTRVQLRIQAVTDGGSTTLNAKVWPDGSTEPTGWLVTTNDTTPELQPGGQVGISTYLSGSAANGPVTLSVDNLEVR